jgi:hypothetical protein
MSDPPTTIVVTVGKNCAGLGQPRMAWASTALGGRLSQSW